LDGGKHPKIYALPSMDDHDEDLIFEDQDNKENEMKFTKDDILALGTQVYKLQTQGKSENKYSWINKSPKDGEQNITKIFQYGEKKIHYW
jgi:hypothetical protein